MEKEQIEREILIAYLQRDLGADKAEIPADFDEKLPKAVDEPVMQIRLGPPFGREQTEPEQRVRGLD